MAVGLLMAMVPAVSAYEAHIINVKARVKERLNIIKTMRLATDDEIGISSITFPSDYPNETDDGVPVTAHDIKFTFRKFTLKNNQLRLFMHRPELLL